MATQNISTAVMQRRVEPHKSLDDFPTPPWATRALLEHLAQRGWINDLHEVREPCANRGHMVDPLREFFPVVWASDIHNYGRGFPIFDYVGMEVSPEVDWTFANPPFRLAEAFIERMLATSRIGCAVIVRTSFLEGVNRYKGLWAKTPPALTLQFAERVVMHKGKLSAKGSTATSYCWIVWRHGHIGVPEQGWIGPCRKRLERASDYEGYV